MLAYAACTLAVLSVTCAALESWQYAAGAAMRKYKLPERLRAPVNAATHLLYLEGLYRNASSPDKAALLYGAMRVISDTDEAMSVRAAAAGSDGHVGLVAQMLKRGAMAAVAFYDRRAADMLGDTSIAPFAGHLATVFSETLTTPDACEGWTIGNTFVRNMIGTGRLDELALMLSTPCAASYDPNILLEDVPDETLAALAKHAPADSVSAVLCVPWVSSARIAVIEGAVSDRADVDTVVHREIREANAATMVAYGGDATPDRRALHTRVNLGGQVTQAVRTLFDTAAYAEGTTLAAQMRAPYVDKDAVVGMLRMVPHWTVQVIEHFLNSDKRPAVVLAIAKDNRKVTPLTLVRYQNVERPLGMALYAADQEGIWLPTEPKDMPALWRVFFRAHAIFTGAHYSCAFAYAKYAAFLQGIVDSTMLAPAYIPAHVSLARSHAASIVATGLPYKTDENAAIYAERRLDKLAYTVAKDIPHAQYVAGVNYDAPNCGRTSNIVQVWLGHSGQADAEFCERIERESQRKQITERQERDRQGMLRLERG